LHDYRRSTAGWVDVDGMHGKRHADSSRHSEPDGECDGQLDTAAECERADQSDDYPDYWWNADDHIDKLGERGSGNTL